MLLFLDEVFVYDPLEFQLTITNDGGDHFIGNWNYSLKMILQLVSK